MGAGGGGGVAAYHDHRARGHGGDGCQSGFVAAFARRVNDDDIGARALGGQLGRSGTGVLAAEVGLVGGKAQAGGGLFRAVYSLGHDLNAYQAAAVGQHRKPDRAHAAVEIQQEIIRRQRGKFPRFGIQGFGGGGVDLVKFVHTHPKRDPGQRILDIPGTERHTGFSTQNHIGAGVVAVDENGR